MAKNVIRFRYNFLGVPPSTKRYFRIIISKSYNLSVDFFSKLTHIYTVRFCAKQIVTHIVRASLTQNPLLAILMSQDCPAQDCPSQDRPKENLT